MGSIPSTGKEVEERDGPCAPAWHSREVDHVLAELETEEKGLSAEEAKRRLEAEGPNELPGEKSAGPVVRFFRQFHDVLIYLLIAAAVVTALLGEWIDTWVILAVVVVNAAIGFIQEGKAERALEAIREMLSLRATVLRGGDRTSIPAAEVVPGDIILFESGDRVPADIRLIAAKNVRVEEAPLTGESEPVEKSPDPVEEDSGVGDRSSMLFSGTMVTRGGGKGVVVATGADTEVGKIGTMVAGVETLTTPLLRAIGRFGRTLAVTILLFSGAVFAFGYLFREYTVAELFMIAVSLAVAAIPEGLPAIITITLALGVQRMAGRNAIIRRLPAVETLGSVTVICTDKTGTLTRNEMMAREITTPAGRYSVTGDGYRPEGSFLSEDEEEIDPGEEPILSELLRCGFLCSDAEVRPEENGDDWTVHGDPTEGAMVVLGRKAGWGKGGKEEYTREDVVPFASEHRFMATLDEGPEGRYIHLKGAPETVLDLCDRQRGHEGSDEEIDRDGWIETVHGMADRGQRVLALAMKPTDRDELDPEQLGGLTLLGMVGMIDPPRAEAEDAVRECQEAGIRVKMITGDHLATAQAIGRQLGIGEDREAIAGKQLEAMSDDELERAVVDHDVFARSSPEHKIRIVQALQKLGEVVAMTGDGVNDAPALKRADVGVAMGIKGSEASKEAAEMVLADDNFVTIERAVEEGRTIYDNLRKTILFILPTNGAQALVVIAAVVFAFAELPLTPVQILWINLITAVTLALALAFESAEPGIMRRPPRDPDASIITGHLLWRITFVSGIIAALAILVFFRSLALGAPLEVSRTLAVNALAAGQLAYLFNSRYIIRRSLSIEGLIGNRMALLTAGLLIVFQLGFTYLPVFHLWFGTAPLEGHHWLWVLGVAAVVFFAVELEKWVVRMIRDRSGS